MIRAFRKTLAGSLIWDGRGLRNKTGLLLLALVATAEQKALPAQQGEKQGSQAGAGGLDWQSVSKNEKSRSR